MITRDEYGIPSISADSVDEAWFELGFACAEDRLWQLEYDRRRATGRWAEVVGASALAADRLARRLDLGPAVDATVDAMDQTTPRSFEAYAAGMNAQVAEAGLSPEYAIAGLDWQDWTPRDSVLAFTIRHVLMGAWQYKIARGTLWARFGPEAATLMDPRPMPGMPVTVPPTARIPGTTRGGGADPREGLLAAAQADVEAAAEHLGFLSEAEGGSNAWVLAGSRTASGKPLLANDSHRALDAPNAYWQAHLSCPEFRVSGATFPGLPGFPHFGHNGHVGWAITNAAGDAQDLFIEEFHDEQVRTAAGWQRAEVHTERIRVRDGEDQFESCWRTPNGPVVHGDPATGYALSLKWTVTDEPCSQFSILTRMLTADSVSELLDVQEGWVDPINNLVAADIDGHIGYMLRGSLPARRSLASTQIPVPGWEDQHQWTGRVSFTAMPRSEDPEEGLFVTSNNTVTANERPFLSHALNDVYRNERIHELVAAGEGTGLTAQDMRSWQGDTTSVAARRWAELLADRGPFHAEAEDARRQLIEAAGDLGPADTAGLLHACFRREVAVRVLGERLGAEARDWMLSGTLPGQAVLLRRWFATLTWKTEAPGHWAPQMPAEELSDDLLEEALSAAWGRADKLGWPRWGEVHRTSPTHPLRPLIGATFDPPQVGIGGDNETIQNGAYGWAPGGPFTITNLSVYRQVLNLDNLGKSAWVIPGGASGRPDSAHASDQIEIWQRHELVPMHERNRTKSAEVPPTI